MKKDIEIFAYFGSREHLREDFLSVCFPGMEKTARFQMRTLIREQITSKIHPLVAKGGKRLDG